MAWRVAKSLLTLLGQVNAAFPNRSKSIDGTIGNEEHSSRDSDHNPTAAGVVCALDITHDPAHGVDAGALAERLRQSKDRRIKYIISNARIANYQAVNGEAAWTWRPYHGKNDHRHHFHVSVRPEPSLYDDTSPWVIGGAITKPPAPVPTPVPIMPSDPLRRDMAKWIVDFEARRDSSGHLAVYKLPAGDGGGTYEVAGINDRYHPSEAAHLAGLIRAGRYGEAEISAADFIVGYTNVVRGWSDDPGVEFYLRDCCFNRGPTGAARILQRAVGVNDDGKIGTETRAAIDGMGRADLLTALRKAREQYERDVAHRDESSKFWKGLVNRWDNALKVARQFSADTPAATQELKQQEPTPVTPKEKAAGGLLAALAAAGAAAWQFVEDHPVEIAIGITVFAIAAGLVAHRYLKGHWLWQTSIGDQLLALSPHSPPSSELYLDQLSARLAASSADSPATSSPPPLASKPRRKQSAKPSRKTRTQKRSSNSSKRSAVSKSSRKRKSR